MRSSRFSFLLFAACLVGATGCETTPTRGSAHALLASDEVARELLETRPAFAELPAEHRAAMHLWLHANCAIDFERRGKAVATLPRGADAALIEAFQMGPPIAFLEELRDSRRRRFEAVREELQSGEDIGLSPGLKARLAAMTEEQYVNGGFAAIVASYRVAALDGLGLVGEESAMAWLKRTQPTLKDPELRRAAERAMAAIVRRRG